MECCTLVRESLAPTFTRRCRTGADIGRSFVARVCGALDPTDPTSLVIPGPDPDEIAAFSEAVPPMRGAELLTPALLGDLWTDIGTALRVEVGRFKDGGVQGYLKKQSSVWNVVGRVCFHLADNKRDRDYPFAFIATLRSQGLEAGDAPASSARAGAQGVRRCEEPSEAAGATLAAGARGREERFHPRASRLR